MKSGSWLACLLVGAVAAAPGAAAGLDWAPFAERDVVRVLTEDADGDPRETKVWIVVLDGRGYVRTNDSRWLANIRRGSPVALRADEVPAVAVAVAVREVADADVAARVEEAFLEKYGFLQRVMSTLRISQPTVLELSAPGSG